MFRGMQWRVTAWFMLIIIVGMGALGGYLTVSVRNVQLTNLKSDLRSEAVLMAAQALPYLDGTQDPAGLEALVKSLGTQTATRFTIIRRDGTVVADSDEDPALMSNHANRPEVVEAIAGGTGEATRLSATLGEQLIYIAVPVTSGDTTLGVARVALPSTRVDAYVGRSITTILIALAVIAVAVIVAAWLTTRYMTRPVRELTAAARRLAAGEFEVPLAQSAPDESGQLARAFNEMAVQLRSTVDELTEDRARLTAILDNMADGIITTDADGAITLANRAAGDLLGFRPERAARRPMIESVRDYELTEVLQRSLSSRRPEEIQFESSATGRFVRAIAIGGERSSGPLILLQDLTEVRALQTMRREIVGNISHDFRTPLAGIKAMVDTLQDGAIDDHDAALDFLTRIQDEVARLTHMVAELTELSRIETGRTGLEWSQVDLNALVRETLVQMAPQAERQQLTMTPDLAADLPAVPADAERLRQLIINLLHNAVKFNRPGGSITVTTRLEGDAVTLAVADTGLGIPRRDLPRIFERFYMGDRSRTGQGSGMGLAIAKHIVEAHGGSIAVTSTEGKGSTFIIRLPRSRPGA